MQISQRKFPPLGLHKGILNSPCLLILLIKYLTNSMSSFPLKRTHPLDINTSPRPRFHIPSLHASSITIPLSPSIPLVGLIHLPPKVSETPTIVTLGDIQLYQKQPKEDDFDESLDDFETSKQQ